MSKKKILIVEDEGVAALEMKEFLEKEGFDVVDTVDTANKVVKTALNNRIDLIIMDINLKSFIDGIDAAERINIMKTIPIIFLTAYPSSMIEHRAMKAKPAAYIEKPVEHNRLLEVINKTLS